MPSIITNYFAQKLQSLSIKSFIVRDWILQMDSKKNNLLWFDSPFRKGFNLENALILKAEAQLQPEESIQLKSIAESPLAFQNKNTPRNTMSPWSKLLYFQENQYYQNEQKYVYSDQQNQDEITPPIKKEESNKDESEAMPTTAKKSSFDYAAFERKSRPFEKGLRKLSQRAFQIVRELKNATYKEVATTLAQQLNNLDLQGENKEEQNIKRRVYDALNVLIALGVLRKDGRKIVSESGPKKRKQFEEIGNEQLNCLREKVEEKQAKILEKRRRLIETENKYKSIRSLLHRNKQQNYSKSVVVSFPFIGILLPEDEIKQKTNVQHSKFILRSDYSARLFGDIDSLKWLGNSLGETTSSQNTSNEKTSTMHSEEYNKSP